MSRSEIDLDIFAIAVVLTAIASDAAIRMSDRLCMFCGYSPAGLRATDSPPGLAFPTERELIPVVVPGFIRRWLVCILWWRIGFASDLLSVDTPADSDVLCA